MSVPILVAVCTAPDVAARLDAYANAEAADTRRVLAVLHEWGVVAQLRQDDRWRTLLHRWRSGQTRASVGAIDDLFHAGLSAHAALLPAAVWIQPPQMALSPDLLPVDVNDDRERIAA